MANLQLFQNNQMKHYSWNLYLLKSEVQDCRAVGLGKKGQFSKDFFDVFEILEYPLLFEHFQNVSIVQFGSRL